MGRRHVDISRFLSYVLRHQPAAVGLQLDDQGWTNIDQLLAACAAHGKPLMRSELELVVADNDKKRFAISADGLRIRASQGHSVGVELGYEPSAPPEVLYHGTAVRFIESIRREGLARGNRHHVHLSADQTTARSVGARHGPAVVLTVRSGAMWCDGFTFFISANGVWLTESVPPGYLEEINGEWR